MNATAHFRARSQQRGISPEMVEFVLDYGCVNPRGDLTLLGAKEIERAINKLNQVKRDLERLRSHGGAAVAHDADTLITTFHRRNKFKRT